MPILTVAQYRSMSQTPGTPPTDEDIQLALDRYEGLIVGYTARTFSHAARCETHYPAGRGPVQLNVYPATEITGVSVDGIDVDVTTLRVHLASGLIKHDGDWYDSKVVVSYNAGFADAPHEIKTVEATLVESYLAGLTGGLQELQQVRKESVAGVATVDYGTPGQMTANYGTPYAELGPYVSVLERYREPGLL